MRLLFIADGRSPIAQSWMRYFVEGDHEVHLLTTSAVANTEGFASVQQVSVAFSGSRAAKAITSGYTQVEHLTHGGSARMRLRSAVRHWLGPFTLAGAARDIQPLVRRLRPDLMHALRIPFEGMLAGRALSPIPLILSAWGNDFTLHARASPGMGYWTRRALRRADGLITDCRADIANATEWGYAAGKPVLVVPGNGGVRTDIFHPGEARPPSPRSRIWLESIPETSPVVINPRGIRSYIRNDTFFAAIPAILAAYPEAVFLCPGMAGEPEAEARLSRLGVGRAVRLLPRLQAEEMAALFRRADVSVSPSEHDGTPNTLLESMACGCLPVAGDLVSIREWIEPDGNGLLFDPAQPEDLARSVIEALGMPSLREQAASLNNRLVRDWAGYGDGMGRAAAFYAEIARSGIQGRANHRPGERPTPPML